MTPEDEAQLAALKARGKKLHDDFTKTGRATFRQPMRVPVDKKWWDTSGVPGGNYTAQMVNATVTNEESYQLARRTMVNDVATFQQAVARADQNGEIKYVPGQGFTTVTAADARRATTTTWIAVGTFFATDTLPLLASPYGMLRLFAPVLPVLSRDLPRGLVRSGDGEILVMGESAPDFGALMQARGEPEYAAFDLLWLNGRDLRELPFTEEEGAAEETPCRSGCGGLSRGTSEPCSVRGRCTA